MPPHNIVRFYKQIVKKATAAGLKVIASVCDQGKTKVKAINTRVENTKREAALKNEMVEDGIISIDGQQIIPLFDPPHLLKSFRNNMLTKDVFFVENGRRRIAKWSYIVLDHRHSLRSMRKLSKHHIIPAKIKKIKVFLCSPMFGATVASFIDLIVGATLQRSEGKSLPSKAFDTSVLTRFLDFIFNSINGGFRRVSEKVLRGIVIKIFPSKDLD